MKSLRAAIYLWFKKRELKRETKVIQTLETASDFLIHLPKSNPIFAVPAVRGLKKNYPRARFWGIGWEQERQFLELAGIFDELLVYKTEPKLFSSEFKNLAVSLKKKPGVYLDFNRPGSKEFALLSQAELRWGFFAEGSYPFFNLLVKDGVAGDEFDKNSALIASLVAVESERAIPLTVAVPKRRNPAGLIKSLGESGKRLIVAEGINPELALKLKQQFDAAVIEWKKLEDPELLPALVSNCDLFIGRASVAFEIALALSRPILLLVEKGAQGLNLDSIVRAESDQVLDQVGFILTHGKTKRGRERIGLSGNEAAV